MIKKINIHEGFQYQKLSPEEMKARGILGRLIGPCADFKNPTRNERYYSEKLWENVFENPIMKEKIKNKVCYGELGHPEDRTEIDMEKIAICLAEQPKKGDDGKLWAIFDILDTPNGRILKTCCDYGSIPAISSRGQGDLITDDNGNEAVDPDTYECECFDIVLIPGVETARLQYVTEGYNKKTLKQALTESFNNETEEGKKIMNETLKQMHINLNESANVDSIVAAQEKLDDKKEEAIKELNAKKEEIEDKINTIVDTGKGINSETGETIEFEDAPEVPTTPVEEPVAPAPVTEPVPEVEDTITEDVDDEDEIDGTEDPTEEDDVIEDFEVKGIDICKKLIALLDSVTTEENKEEIEDAVNDMIDEFDLSDEDCANLGIELSEEESENPESVASDENTEEVTEPVEPESIEEVPEETTEISTEENSDEINKEKDENEIEEAPEEVEEALDKGSSALIKSLTEALESKSALENTFKQLQEKLAVSDAKVNELTEECEKYKSGIVRLSEMAKANKELNENVAKLQESLDSKEKEINDQKVRISRLVSMQKEKVNESLTIKENNDSQIKQLNEKVNGYETELKALNEAKVNSESQLTELNEKLTKSTKLTEAYKKLATKTMNKYIETRAVMLGLTSTDIKRKLGESYTVEDVDKVCEELKAYQINVSRLPFSVGNQVSVKVNESNTTSPIRRAANKAFEDDDVDDNLIRLAGF